MKAAIFALAILLSAMTTLATAADAAALSGLARRAFQETFVDGFQLPYTPSDLATFLQGYAPEKTARWISDARAHVLGAEDAGGSLVAYAHAGDNALPVPVGDGDGSGAGELKRLYVLRSAQGAGLGKALLERSLAWLGARRVYIGVWSGNNKAQRLYSHYGFAVVGGYKYVVGDTFDDEYIMARDG